MTIGSVGCQLVFPYQGSPIEPDGPTVGCQLGYTKFGAAIAISGLSTPLPKQPVFDASSSPVLVWWASGLTIHAAPLRAGNNLGTEVALNLEAGPLTDPTLSADGKTLMYRNGNELRRATRTGEPAQFGPAVSVIGGSEALGIDLSADGTALYFATPSQQLTRATISANGLAGIEPLDVLIGTSPAVSSDNSEVFFQRGMTIVRAVSLGDGTYSQQDLLDGFDPDLSPDNLTMIFVAPSGDGLLIAQRSCL